MHAIEVHQLTGPAALRLGEAAEPEPAGRVIIDVHAAGVSFPDLLLSCGRYQASRCCRSSTAPMWPVLSGPHRRAAACAPRRGWRPSPAVAAGPTWWRAQSASSRYRRAFPMRAGARLPLNYLTAHLALCRRGRIQAGETILVLGAFGGIGTAVIQVANASGARAIAAVSPGPKAQAARQAGAAEVTAVRDGWADEVRELTAGRGVDIVADPVGGDLFESAPRQLAAQGRYLVLEFAGGAIPQIKVNRLLLGNVDLVGIARGPTVRAEPGYARAQWAQLLPMIEQGHVRPVPGGSYPLAEAAGALRQLEHRRAVGKITLQVR